jgi:sporulation protein YlmC with PRC-barrel domain
MNAFINSKMRGLRGVVITLSLATATLLAESPPNGKSTSKSSPKAAAAGPLERLGRVNNAGDMLGQPLRNLSNEKLGRIEEVLVDVESGRILEVIVSMGGVKGFGNHPVAVLPGAISRETNKGVFQLSVAREKVKGAPQINLANWHPGADTNHVLEVYHYYGEKPFFAERRFEQDAKPRRLGHLERGSKVLGMSLENARGEKLGRVEDLMFDLENGRIVQVIISIGAVKGLGDELSAVPPTVLRYTEARNGLLLDVGKDALALAPHFKRDQWPAWNARFAGENYRAFGVEPYFVAETRLPERTARDREAGKLKPTDQGRSPEDIATTRNIRKEVVARKDLSLSARNVKIITVAGRVTLRGQVNNEAERDTIVEIAQRIGGPDRVEDQVELKQTSFSP